MPPSESPPVDLGGETDYDVIIVGAGISGLTAADELRRRAQDLRVLVVEAKDRVGGRTLTIEMTGNHQKKEKFDIGGQWVGHTQTHILEVLQQLKLETYGQYSEGKKWAQMGISKPRPYSSSLPTSSLRHYGLFEVFDFLVNMTKMEFLKKKVNLLNVFEWNRAQNLDDMTVSKWAKENCYTRATQDAIEICIRSVYGVEANRMSMLFHLYYSKSAGSVLDLVECVGDGAQTMKVQGGTQQISEKLAEPFIKEKCLLFKKAVHKIDVDEPTMTARLHLVDTSTDKNGEPLSYSTRRVILAIPPNQCAKIHFNPDVPSLKRRLFDSSCQGNLIKFLITYQTAFWRKEGFSGEIISTGRTVVEGQVLPVVCAFDGCSGNGTPAIVGFIDESYADSTKENRCNEVVKDLVRFLGDGAFTQFIDYEEKVWAQEPYNGGCPVTYGAPGQMDAFQTIRDPYHSVHFAGTETATHWMGYMSGAVQSGRRAAHEVLHALERDTVINYNYLSDSCYAEDYRAPQPPSNTYIERFCCCFGGFGTIPPLSSPSTNLTRVRSPWWRRIFFFGALCFGIWAYSKKYQLSRTAKAIRPMEKAAIGWLFDSPWPG